MEIEHLIKTTRIAEGLSQTEFGRRFGVTDTAVSFWEDAKREAPYRVIEYCLRDIDSRVICDKCSGTGVVRSTLKAE